MADLSQTKVRESNRFFPLNLPFNLTRVCTSQRPSHLHQKMNCQKVDRNSHQVIRGSNEWT